MIDRRRSWAPIALGMAAMAIPVLLGTAFAEEAAGGMSEHVDETARAPDEQ